MKSRRKTTPKMVPDLLSMKAVESVDRGVLDCNAGMVAPMPLGLERDDLEEQFCNLHYAYNALEKSVAHIQFVAATALTNAREARTEWAAVYNTACAGLNAARFRSQLRRQRPSSGGGK